jgi:Protein of unknown function (DUF3348)
MTRALTRTHFHSSRLIRILTDLAAVRGGEPGTAFAEKLGLWVDYTHAITLCAVHNASPQPDASPAAPAATAAALAPGLGEEFAQLRAGLERAMAAGKLPTPEPADMPPDTSTAFEPYRRYYLTQQRDMEQKVGPLRARLREALTQASPRLAQLAALDAALDGILSEREGKLLSALAQLLKKRFAHLRQSLPPAAWLAQFGQELQTVLLAELDLRLQPAVGLLEALHNEKTK